MVQWEYFLHRCARAREPHSASPLPMKVNVDDTRIGLPLDIYGREGMICLYASCHQTFLVASRSTEGLYFPHSQTSYIYNIGDYQLLLTPGLSVIALVPWGYPSFKRRVSGSFLLSFGVLYDHSLSSPPYSKSLALPIPRYGLVCYNVSL